MGGGQAPPLRVPIVDLLDSLYGPGSHPNGEVFPDRPDGVVENILITSHLKSDNAYIIRQNPTLILEGYDIAFKRAGYKRFRLAAAEFAQFYWAKEEVEFLE